MISLFARSYVAEFATVVAGQLSVVFQHACLLHLFRISEVEVFEDLELLFEKQVNVFLTDRKRFALSVGPRP